MRYAESSTGNNASTPSHNVLIASVAARASMSWRELSLLAAPLQGQRTSGRASDLRPRASGLGLQTRSSSEATGACSPRMRCCGSPRASRTPSRRGNRAAWRTPISSPPLQPSRGRFPAGARSRESFAVRYPRRGSWESTQRRAAAAPARRTAPRQETPTSLGQPAAPAPQRFRTPSASENPDPRPHNTRGPRPEARGLKPERRGQAPATWSGLCTSSRALSRR